MRNLRTLRNLLKVKQIVMDEDEFWTQAVQVQSHILSLICTMPESTAFHGLRPELGDLFRSDTEKTNKQTRFYWNISLFRTLFPPSETVKAYEWNKRNNFLLSLTKNHHLGSNSDIHKTYFKSSESQYLMVFCKWSVLDGQSLFYTKFTTARGQSHLLLWPQC